MASGREGNTKVYTMTALIQYALDSTTYKNAVQQLEWEHANGEEPRPYKNIQDVASAIVDVMGGNERWAIIYEVLRDRLLEEFEKTHPHMAEPSEEEEVQAPAVTLSPVEQKLAEAKTLYWLHSATIPNGPEYTAAKKQVMTELDRTTKDPTYRFTMDQERDLFRAAAQARIATMDVDTMRRMLTIELGDRMHYHWTMSDFDNESPGEGAEYFDYPDENS